MSHTAPNSPAGIPPEGTSPEHHLATPQDGPTGPTSFWRSVPLWAWIVAGVAVVALIVTAVIMLTTKDAPEPIVLDAETVTAEAPTPGVEPIERNPATAFETALPSVVRGWAVASDEPATDLVAAGALEGRALTYTDGAAEPVELALVAGLWATVEAADARLDAVVAGLGAVTESGAVPAEGAPLGRFALVESGDTATVVWTNGSAVLQLSGPTEAVREAYLAFPL